MKRSTNSWQNVLTKLGFQRTSRRRASGGRRGYSYSRRSRFESLEDRQMLATTIFLDFGAGIGVGNTLSATREELKNIFGETPNPYRGTGPYYGESEVVGGTHVEFAPLAYDWDGSGTFDATDIQLLGDAVLPNVERAVEPFDINVEIAGAADYDDARDAIAANNDYPNNLYGKNDAYVFVLSINTVSGWAFGMQGGYDRESLAGNRTDEAATAATNNLLGRLTDDYSSPDTLPSIVAAEPGTAVFNDQLAQFIANVVVHEVGHTFTLWHKASTAAVGDVLDMWGYESLRDTSNIVTRFPLVGDVYQNSYLVLAEDLAEDIELRDENRDTIPDLAYVTGTGAHDQITLTDSGLGSVDVLVEAFDDAAHTIPLQYQTNTLSYTIDLATDTEGTILIDASLGDDLIMIDSTIAADFRIRGGAGNDHVQIVDDGTGAITSLDFMGERGDDTLTIDYGSGDPFTSGLVMFDGGDGDDQILIEGASGAPITTEQIDGQVTVDFDSDAVTYALSTVERLEVDDSQVSLTSTYYVNTSSDEVDLAGSDAENRLVRAGEDGVISLRAALQAANRASGDATIRFDSSVTDPIVLANGELQITSDVDVEGPGADLLTIDGDDQSRVLNVGSGTTVSLSGLTISGGGAVTYGGGIYSVGDLTLDGVAVDDNDATIGGGIYQLGGSLQALNSTVTRNTATVTAGAHIQNATVDIVNTTVSTNAAVAAVGGIYITYPQGPFANLVNVTVANNNSGAGGGGGIYAGTGAYTVRLANCIVAGNQRGNEDPDDVLGVFDATSNHNLIGFDTNSNNNLENGEDGNQVGVGDPGLDQLGYYGGPTETHALLYDSLAIDTGDNTEAAGLSFDQRGYPFERTVDGDGDSTKTADIGAFEFQTPRVVDVTISGSESVHPDFDFSTGTYFNPITEQIETVIGSGNQLRTVPVGDADTVSITFNKDVVISEDDLEIIGLAKGQLPTPAAEDPFAYDNEHFVATWRYSSRLKGDQYLIRISDSVTDTSGGQLALDGEWTNPTSINVTSGSSTFPSGDGVAGGDFEFVFTILPGDANRDNDVDGIDIGIMATHWYESGMTFTEGDFNGDGIVENLDNGLLGTYWVDDFTDLEILADFDGDFDVEVDDETAFMALYNAEDSGADLNGDSVVDEDDLALFEAFAQFDIELDVILPS